jgi:alpha-mannosidase
MIGNAHIDPVWQWSWQAGVDEALATFRSAADRCDEYPEFIFTRGEAWLYRQVEMLDPDLFARVRQMIDRGQWHVTGGEVVQPDSNLPTAAGARQQIEHGRRYFQECFGVHCTVGYNVDSFGQTATLPDLLASLGFTGYVFGRPDATQVALPATTVRWQGVGGGEILLHRFTPAYVTRTDDVYGNVMASVAAADPALGHTMCFYGVGNHGGGPTKGAIEYIRDHAHALPGLELRFSTPAAYFAAIADKRDRLPLVTVELQHCFPGCYSVMHDIKQNQRLGEHLLSQAESLIQRFVDAPEERQTFECRLNTAWDDLLFTQFHDVLTGTSTPSAWGPSGPCRGGRASPARRLPWRSRAAGRYAPFPLSTRSRSWP